MLTQSYKSSAHGLCASGRSLVGPLSSSSDTGVGGVGAGGAFASRRMSTGGIGWNGSIIGAIIAGCASGAAVVVALSGGGSVVTGTCAASSGIGGKRYCVPSLNTSTDVGGEFARRSGSADACAA